MRMWTRYVCVLIAVFGITAAWTGVARAERRLAFVVGIDAYPNLGPDAQLQRAVSDADAVGDALGGLGFTVSRVTKAPATQETILRRFADFVGTIEAGDLVLFYFSGHGIGLDGANYLLPSDVPTLRAGDERLIKARALAETDVSADIRAKGARVVVLVLDSCRNDPFADAGHRSLSLSRGLARVEPASGVLTIYAASAGRQALDRLSDTDDPDPNSVFTRVFIKTLKQPGVNVSELGDRVRDDVAALARSAGQDQVPAVSNEVVGARGIFLAGRGEPTQAVTSQGSTPPASLAPCGRLFDAARSIDTAQAYQAYLDQCPGDSFVAMAVAAKARLSPSMAETAPTSASATRSAEAEPASDSAIPPSTAPIVAPPAGPSFNCAFARSRVEHAICDTPRLGAADRTLDAAFKQVASGLTATAIVDLTKEQGIWLRQRNACQQQPMPDAMLTCLDRNYDERIASLRQLLPSRADGGEISPSFDCHAARSAIEKMICGDRILADRDRRLSVLFAQRLQSLSPPKQKALAREQLGWWTIRESCTQILPADLRACVLNAYDQRIQDLGRTL